MKQVADKWYGKRYATFFNVVSRYAESDSHVLVIGANDGVQYDPIRHVWRDSWKATYIEPNPRAMKLLQENIKTPKAQFIQCAIGDHDGFMNLYMMTDEAAKAFGNVTDADGSALTSTIYDHIASRIKKKIPHMLNKNFPDMGMSKLIESHKVPCRLLESLLDERGIEKVDIIQEDTEGMDVLIMEQIYELIMKNRIRPRIMMYEHRHTLVHQRRDLMEKFEKKSDYKAQVMGNDTVLWRETYP
jgi:FkbM family methyltransferase